MLFGLGHAVRACRILLCLGRHGVLGLLPSPPIPPRLARLLRWLDNSKAEGSPGERLVRALIELGPTFVKFGQSLATRPDLVGVDVATQLARLQDELEPFDGAEARAIVAAQLGAPVEELFSDFENKAHAAASIAQVHFAVTTEGDPVAVKILRPGIEDAIEADLAFFGWIARWLDRLVPDLRRHQPRAAVETFAETTRRELDLRLEAAAAAEFRQNARNDEGFRVPEVDWQRTAKKVLTLERVGGIASDDRDALIKAGVDPDKVLEIAARVFFQQVFRDGFFHGDMHPGNMFIDAQGEIIPVDFGIMGRLDLDTRLALGALLLAFLKRDYGQVAKVLFDLSLVPPGQDPGALGQACRSIGEPIMDRPLNEISFGRLLGQLFEVTAAFEMRAQPHLLLLQKTMVVAEGVGRALNPKVNMWQLAQPLVEDWLAEHFGPMGQVRSTASRVQDIALQAPRLISKAEAYLDSLPPPGQTAIPWWPIIATFIFGLITGIVLG
ncbi:MAG: 2-polyprenylphenol 6-hydroxylase [Geminicoccaceae bacterium]